MIDLLGIESMASDLLHALPGWTQDFDSTVACRMINIGALIASLLVVNLQTKVSWAWGYAVPTMAFGLALTLFLLGTRLYKHVPPGGSALTRIGQV
jgi:dipeptide/tripeptide permease